LPGHTSRVGSCVGSYHAGRFARSGKCCQELRAPLTRMIE
jgi:hypothetical protein